MEAELSPQIPVKRFKKALLAWLDETFSNVRGIYLDKGTTLYETLDGVSADEASRAISPKSATIAAQVEHIRFYLDVLDDYMRTGVDTTNNWFEKWDGKYDVAGALSILVHTAYHLGGIRQALGAIRSGTQA